MAERRLLVVRHPETEANVTGRWIGRGDSPYTERGVLQAGLLADEIAGFRPDSIWTSPLYRCRHVAERAAGGSGVSFHVDERLIELDFGRAEGLTYDETVARDIRFDFKAEDLPVAEGGESRRAIFDRTARALDDIIGSGASRMAVVTHGGVFRSTIPNLLGLPLSAIWSFHISNGAVLEYRIIEGFVQVVRFVHVG